MDLNVSNQETSVKLLVTTITWVVICKRLFKQWLAVRVWNFQASLLPILFKRELMQLSLRKF